MEEEEGEIGNEDGESGNVILLLVQYTCQYHHACYSGTNKAYLFPIIIVLLLLLYVYFIHNIP